MHRIRHLLCIIFLLAWLAGPGPASALAPAQAPPPPPLLFIENAGQFAADVLYQVHGAGWTLWLAEDGLWLTVYEEATPPAGSPQERKRARATPRRAVNLKLSFAGANTTPRLEATGKLSTKVSFFLGSDPAAWRRGVPVWSSVRYENLYPGVDLELTGEGGRLVQKLVARGAAGAASLAQVRWQVEGADSVSLDAERGCLVAQTALGEVTLPLLQVEGATPTGRPSLEGNSVIAPFAQPRQGAAVQAEAGDLEYATFLGGLGADLGTGIAVDGAGQAYVIGHTDSTDEPAQAGVVEATYTEGDIFVVKLSAAGDQILYALVLGGSAEDWACDIALDGSGQAYICGDTMSIDFPTTNGAIATAHSGATDAFIAKLNADGTELAYSTLLGGTLLDYSEAIAVGSDGSAYVVGETQSTDWPATPNALGPSLQGAWDACVAKISANGSKLAYATYLGGSGEGSLIDEDWGGDIAVDVAGQAYVTGITGSTDFPVTDGALDTTLNTGLPFPSDAFVSKLKADGTALVYSTYLGGWQGEWGEAIAVDGMGQAYVAGQTTSPDFAVTDGTSYNGTILSPRDAFVVKLNAAGTGLLYGTFYGGADDDYALSLAIDSSGAAYITGETASTDLPTTDNAYSREHRGGSWDAYLARLSPASGLVYATYLGGSDDDWAEAIALDSSSQAYLAGVTESSDFPLTSNPADSLFEGGEAFVVKIAQEPPPPPPVLDKIVYLPLVLR